MWEGQRVAGEGENIMGLVMKYFVLNPSKQDNYGSASREAMKAYASEIRPENPQLADDLLKWITDLESTDGVRPVKDKR